MSLVAGEIQCQAMKLNGLQCNNPAFVTVNGNNYCRLDFNWLVSQQRDGMTFNNLEAQVFPLNPEDQKEVDKIRNVAPLETKDKKEN